jgi:hypothetical protein
MVDNLRSFIFTFQYGPNPTRITVIDTQDKIMYFLLVFLFFFISRRVYHMNLDRLKARVNPPCSTMPWFCVVMDKTQLSLCTEETFFFFFFFINIYYAKHIHLII